jgi:hypothetical protein
MIKFTSGRSTSLPPGIKEYDVLSVRQPWAWLIVNGFKDIENRVWSTSFFGPLLIHAGKTMTRADYEACQIFVGSIDSEKLKGLWFPTFSELKRGGIVGACDMKRVVTSSTSPWFVGPFGLVLGEAYSLPFHPCPGRLGFFKIRGNFERQPVGRV